MEVWLFVMIASLFIIIFILIIKLMLIQKSTRDIGNQLKERLMNETNTLLDLTYQDKNLCRLVEQLNIELHKLHKQRHRFQQGDLELKTAITNISHDLRTPLMAINAYLDLLDHVEKSETAQRYLGVIRNRTEEMEQLTEELFRYSMITSPEYENSVELVVVNRILEESILDFYAALQKRNITPIITMTKKKIIREGNQTALSRVFSNLMNNAIKYSDGDLHIVLNDAGQIFFSNTASSLNELEVERLFHRFYTVENARKSTGLGLSISRRLIEQMNGTISAQYENERLTICIQLPDVSKKHCNQKSI